MTDEVALNVKLDADSDGVVTETRRGAAALDDYQKTVDRGSKGTASFSRAQRDAEKAGKALGNSVRLLTGLMAGLGAVQIASKFKETAVETDRLRASLRTMTGDAESAAGAFSALEQFAKRTPFTLDQSINAFIKMRALGLEPTEQALSSFGDTATAMGKDLNQMIEAVADASTFEFERLKEFGIKAKQEADTVSFTFQGVETTVAKSSDAIVGYLTEIGETNFAGAMADQMDALPGLFSNLEDSTDSLFRTIGDLGASDSLSGFVRGVTEEVRDLDSALPGMVHNMEILTDGLVVLGSVVIARTVVPSLVTLTASMRAATVGITAAGVAARAASGAIGLLGGPVGVVLVAATALATFAGNARDAKIDTRQLTDEVRQLAIEFENATRAGKGLIVLEQQSKLSALREQISEVKEELRGLEIASENPRTPGIARKFEIQITRLKARLSELSLAEVEVAGLLQAFNEELGGTSGSLDKFSGAAGKAADSTDTLTDSMKDQIAAFEKANNPAAKFQAAIDEIVAMQKTGKVSQVALNNAIQAAVDAYAKATGAGDEYNDMLEEGKRLTEQMRTPTEEYADEIERLNELLAAGAIEQETYNRASQKALDDLVDSNQKAAEAAAGPWKEWSDQLNESFRDTFIRAGGQVDDFLERVEDSLKEAALRMLYDQTIGRVFGSLFSGSGQLVVQSVGGQQGGILSAGGGGGFNLSSLFGGGGSGTGSILSNLTGGQAGLLTAANWAISQGASSLFAGLNAAGFNGATQTLATGLANTTVLGNQVGNMVGIQGGGAALGGLVTAGGAIVGGYAGNALGEALIGKQAESNIGATVGGVAGGFIGATGATAAGVALGASYGAWAGPIGALIGAAIGAIADVAFGGDGRQRSNTGVLVGRFATDPAFTRTAASGLEIQAYERRGDSASAHQLQRTFLDIDAALTGIAAQAGVDVDFSNTTLRGRHGDAGHTLADGQVGGYFGAVGFNGAEGFSEAPAMFVRDWLAEIEHELPDRVRHILRTVDDTIAEDLIKAFASGVRIDELLDLDVVGRTEEAIDRLLEPQKSLIEQYDELVTRVIDLSAELNGTGQAWENLTAAMEQQKVAAAQLVSLFRGAGIEADQLFGNAIQSIRESMLSEEELYSERRAQIADLTAQLDGATSPEELSRLSNEIIGLTNAAWGSLDASQREALGGEFMTFLNEANAIAQAQVEENIASIAEREEAINNAVQLEIDAAQRSVAAASTMQDAATTIYQAADILSNLNITVTVNPDGTYDVAYGGPVEVTT